MPTAPPRRQVKRLSDAQKLALLRRALAEHDAGGFALERRRSGFDGSPQHRALLLERIAYLERRAGR